MIGLFVADPVLASAGRGPGAWSARARHLIDGRLDLGRSCGLSSSFARPRGRRRPRRARRCSLSWERARRHADRAWLVGLAKSSPTPLSSSGTASATSRRNCLVDARGGRLHVADERVQVLPLAGLVARGLGGDRGERRVVRREREMAELDAGLARARVLLDQRVDRVELVIGARAALEVVEDGDRRPASCGPRKAPSCWMPPKIRCTSLTPPIGAGCGPPVPTESEMIAPASPISQARAARAEPRGSARDRLVVAHCEAGQQGLERLLEPGPGAGRVGLEPAGLDLAAGRKTSSTRSGCSSQK